MIPNIIYARKNQDEFENKFNNEMVEYLENIGRYGSLIFLVFNIPKTYYNFWFSNALRIYLLVNGSLLVFYLLIWIFMWRKNKLIRVIFLSVLPSIIFIFSSIMILSIPLIIFSILFSITHIYISVINYIKS